MHPDRLRSDARSFVLKAIAWSVGLFGLLRLSWIETQALLPFTQFQGRVAEAVLGAPALPIQVTLACSGADAIALCAGAILAYPATWRDRLGGLTGGLALILVLNTVRIGTLGRAAASPTRFETLHVYVWPALLILAIAGYVFGWMHVANGRWRAASDAPSAAVAAAPTRRFVVWTAVFVVLFVATSPWYLQSTVVLTAAAFIARQSAAGLGWLGIEATAAANVLWTSKGGFQVTQECISTPLIPLYCATVMTYATSWRWRALAIAAAAPLFIALGIARLLIVALPAAVIGSPVFLIHAFYQILLAALVVCGAAAWRGGRGATRMAMVGCVLGALSAYLLDPVYAGLLATSALEMPFNDTQGAMAALPSFQAGLFVALAVVTLTAPAWRRFAAGVSALALLQVAAFTALHGLSIYTDLAPQIRDVRAWAIAAPVVVMLGVISHDRARR